MGGRVQIDYRGDLPDSRLVHLLYARKELEGVCLE